MQGLLAHAAIASTLSMVVGACTIPVVDSYAGGSATESGSLPETGADGDDGAEFGDGGGSEGGFPDPPLFDVGDGGEFQVSSCEFAAQYPSHFGCEFYGVDLDGPGLFDAEPHGFVVINPLSTPVAIDLARHAGSDEVWTVEHSSVVPGRHTEVLLPSEQTAQGTGIHAGASYRITSDHPIVVIQAHPAAGDAVSSSATMLLPASSWTAYTRVAGWRTHEGVGERAFLAAVSGNRTAPVSVDLGFGLMQGEVPWLDDPLELALGPGELLRLDALAIPAEIDHGVSGTRVNAVPKHPVAVFSAHTCAAVPDFNGSCGHMQEQLNDRLVGQRFFAPRLVAREHPQLGLMHERTMVQVTATEPGTQVHFYVNDGQLLDSIIIDPDKSHAVYVDDEDVAIASDKPIVAAAYMTNAGATGYGSPSMVQLAAIEQWTAHHYVWVPEGFETHALVTAHSGGAPTIDYLSGPQPPLVEPTPLESSEVWAPLVGVRRISRYRLTPGLHLIATGRPSSVVIAGWRKGDGFAYLGGWGLSLADLGPTG